MVTAAAIAATLATATPALAGTSQPRPNGQSFSVGTVVRAPAGALRGTASGNVQRFLGVPYALADESAPFS